MRWINFGLACFCGGFALVTALSANAASNLSNSLTGFTGDSTQAGTQAAVGAAGLSFYSTTGFSDNATPDDTGDDSNDTVTFDSGGAHFGTLWEGDNGRNYMRTIESDYARANFVAEVTFDNSDSQAVFIGLGAGDRALFGTPDWSTLFSSASFWPEPANDKFTRFRTQNDINTFADTGVPTFDAGTHRFRMTFDALTRRLLGEIDINYAGGLFVADATTTNLPIVTTTLYAADGWPSEPSRIFFGGDDGAVFRDLSITVTGIIPEPASIIMLCLGLVAVAARRTRNC